MRADVNLSVREVGSETFGTRTEMKNLNSFKAIGRAIEGERARQIELIEEGKAVVQETRRWEEKLGGQGRILIRPSGTEALIRVMVEAKTAEIAHQVASILADFIKKL